MRVLARVLATVLAVAAALPMNASAGTSSYDERLARLAALGSRFPGDAPPPGLFGGLIVQTRWQRDSGRDDVPLWSIVNDSLTNQPADIAARYDAAAARDRSHVCDGEPAGAPAGPVDACRAWVAYFGASDAYRAGEPLPFVRRGIATYHRPHDVLQSLLWSAHSTSIAARVAERRADLEAGARGVPVEFRFWANWIDVVYAVEAANVPSSLPPDTQTTGTFLPGCAPLGTPGCDLGSLPGGPSLAVWVLTMRPASIDRVLLGYAVVHPPVALAAAGEPPARSSVSYT